MKVEVVTLGIDKTQITPEESVGCLFRSADGIFNIPKDLEDVQKSHQWFGNQPNNIYFISTDSHVEGGDYYIYWSIFGKDYKLAKSNRGEVPKCPHGKVVAATDFKIEIPRIPGNFLVDFINSNGNIKEVELETEEDYDGVKERNYIKLKLTSLNEVIIKIPQEIKIQSQINTNTMKLKTITPEEIVNSKFKDTLVTVEGYLKEAEGYVNNYSDGYSANAVYKRMGEIKKALINDLKNMAKSIEV